MKKKKVFKGFTLAETLIVLAILGVVAAITVPSLVRRQSEAANRTKIKKAMRTYDAAVQQMVRVNDISSMQLLTDFGGNGCAKSVTYFKTVSFLGADKCKFRTSDGLYWDITDISKPIVSLDEENLSSEAAGTEGNNKAFQFVTSFDPKARAFRTNDAQYEITNNGASEEMKKLFAFVKPEIGGAGGSGDDNENQECDDSDSLCKASRGDYDAPCPDPRRVSPSCTDDGGYTTGEHNYRTIFDENSHLVGRFYVDNDGSKVYVHISQGYAFYTDCSSATISDLSTCKRCTYVDSISECAECKSENGCHSSPA